ncbi:MAG: hypothetical protein ACFFAN_05030 [Promethearchaeota archaeon]
MTDIEKKDDKNITFCPVEDMNKNPLSKKKYDLYYSSAFNFAGVFTTSKEREEIFNDTSKKIHKEIKKFINENKIEILNLYSDIKENEEFFISLIRDVFLFLKNETELLENFNLSQLKEIPILIYEAGKKIFANNIKMYSEQEFLEKISNLHGFIYVAVNEATKNRKVYVGLTTYTIEQEWGSILSSARGLLKEREENPDKKKYGRYILNAILKYGEDVWTLYLQDIAYDDLELRKMETYYIVEIFNCIDRRYGYNMTEGGERGIPNQEVRKKLSEAQERLWNDDDYREIQSESVSKGIIKLWRNNPLYGYRVSRGMKKKWKDPVYIKKQNEVRSDPIYLKKKSEIMHDKWGQEDYQKHHKQGMKKYIKHIKDIRGFLTDVKNNMLQRDLSPKYGIAGSTIRREIKDLFADYHLEDLSQLKIFLQDKVVDNVVEELRNKGLLDYGDDNMWENLEFQEKIMERNEKLKKKINDLKGFLIDLKNQIPTSDLIKKYKMSRPTINKKIRKHLGTLDIETIQQARDYLKDKDIDDILNLL